MKPRLPVDFRNLDALGTALMTELSGHELASRPRIADPAGARLQPAPSRRQGLVARLVTTGGIGLDLPSLHRRRLGWGMWSQRLRLSTRAADVLRLLKID